MIKTVKEFIKLFDEHNINYCHWKSSQHLDATSEGNTDLDILIQKDQFEIVEMILPSIGFKKFKVNRHRRYPYLFDFLAYDKDADKIVHLHLHTRLNIGPKHHKYILIPIEQTILQSREQDKEYGIYRINYALELLLLIIRHSVKVRKRDYLLMLLGKKFFSKDYEDELEWLLKRVSWNDICQKEREIFKKEILKNAGILKKVDCYKILKVRRVNKILKKKGYLLYLEDKMTSLMTRWFREVYRIIYEIFKRSGLKNLPNRRSNYRGGMVFAFVGGDGSGKSSVSNDVYKKLNSQMNCIHLYLGTGEGKNSILLSILKPLHLLLHKLGILSVKGKLHSLESNKEHKDSREGLFRDYLKIPWALVLLNDRRKKLKKLRKYIAKGYLVITDRYPQNEIKNIFDGPRLKKAFSKTEQKILTQYTLIDPDIIFRFECSPEVCVERKSGEVILEQASKNLELLKSIKFYHNHNSEKINANLVYSKVISETLELLFKKL